VTEIEPPPGRSRSEQVQAAAIGAVAAILVAVIGLIGVWLTTRSGDASQPTPTPSAHTPDATPEIRILGTTFALRKGGGIAISVTGTVRHFPPSERLYAVAKPATSPDPDFFWASREVAPDLEGSWVARIVADAQPGERVRVFALRYDPGQGGAASPAQARAAIVADGPDAVGVQGVAPPPVLLGPVPGP
jgi:hypothetical protein